MDERINELRQQEYRARMALEAMSKTYHDLCEAIRLKRAEVLALEKERLALEQEQATVKICPPKNAKRSYKPRERKPISLLETIKSMSVEDREFIKQILLEQN